MLQQAAAIRHYQRLTDAIAQLWERDHRLDDIRLYIDGYLAALRHSNAIEPYLIHRLEEEITRFLYDPSNRDLYRPSPEVDRYS